MWPVHMPDINVSFKFKGLRCLLSFLVPGYDMA